MMALLLFTSVAAVVAATPPQYPAYYTAHNITQPVDHFNFKNNGTFQHRYVMRGVVQHPCSCSQTLSRVLPSVDAHRGQCLCINSSSIFISSPLPVHPSLSLARYLLNDTHWGGPSHPIIFYCGVSIQSNTSL